MQQYFGPYRILCQFSDVTYEVENYDHSSKQHNQKDIVHVIHVKPYNRADLQIGDVTIGNVNVSNRKIDVPISGTNLELEKKDQDLKINNHSHSEGL